MEEWKEYKIGDICRIKHGFAFKGIYFVDDPQKYVCVTPGNFALKGGFKNDKPKYYNGPIPEDYVLQKDDLVVTMTDLSKNGDTLGYSALIPYDEHYIFLHNQRIGLIEDISNEIDKHFLYWVMRTYDYQRYIVGHCSGSTVKHTSPSGIGSYIFRCPDMKIQKEISSVLDNLDDKIEINRRINENLEQQAQALFKSWFVDFEPFKNGEFVESELGMIPKGWRVQEAQDVFDINIGKTPPRKEQEWFTKDCNDNVWVSISDMGSCGMFISNSSDYLTDDAIKRFNIQMVEKDSVLLSFKLTVGRVAIANTRLTTNEAIARFILPQNYYREFLYLYLKQYKYDNLGSTSSIATAVNSKIIKGMKLLVPSTNILSEFSEKSKPLFDKIGALLDESRRLAELRDTLLPKLMSGEININEININ